MFEATDFYHRLLGGGASEGYEADEDHFGVHVSPYYIYLAIAFLSCIYISGIFAAKVLQMPALVGEIFCGILLGPNVMDLVPNVEAFVMLGEIGLILLVLEAGIDIDLTTLKLIGARGVMIAVAGTLLPIAIAFIVAIMLGYRGTAAVATGCAFAPTSLGIAMNVLRQSKIANTPVGQLIVAAAIIDDMIALVILSQLQAFTGDSVSIVDMSVPIVSALGFLAIGGFLAVRVVPPVLNRFVLNQVASISSFSRDWVGMLIMFLLVLLLMPMTYYGKASPLMGAFLAGLVFCSDSGAHHMFVHQMKRPMQWLLRIFFAASIGFQVPIKKFGDPVVVIQGLLLTTALIGKIVVGFMAPNFSLTRRFKDTHLRDCLIVGFSMAAEGEFAFVIAAFAVTNKLISEDLYSSIVLAVLLSTILAPFCLRKSISYFNQRVQDNLASTGNADNSLEEGVMKQTTVFYCIQIKSTPSWGILSDIMQSLNQFDLDIIDHRSWHPRQSENILVNEIYAQDGCEAFEGKDKVQIEKNLASRISDIQAMLVRTINQESAIIKVQRWYPEPLLPHSEPVGASSISKATTTALEKSMRSEGKEESYSRMPDPDGHHFSQVEHLDADTEGKLDGLIRHDRPPVTALDSADGVEILDVHGVGTGYREVPDNFWRRLSRNMSY